MFFRRKTRLLKPKEKDQREEEGSEEENQKDPGHDDPSPYRPDSSDREISIHARFRLFDRKAIGEATSTR